MIFRFSHLKPPFLGDFPLPCLMTWEGKLILTSVAIPLVLHPMTILSLFDSESTWEDGCQVNRNEEENPNHPKSMNLPLGMVHIYTSLFWQKFWHKFVDGGFFLAWYMLRRPDYVISSVWNMNDLFFPYFSHILGTCKDPIWRTPHGRNWQTPRRPFWRSAGQRYPALVSRHWHVRHVRMLVGAALVSYELPSGNLLQFAIENGDL